AWTTFARTPRHSASAMNLSAATDGWQEINGSPLAAIPCRSIGRLVPSCAPRVDSYRPVTFIDRAHYCTDLCPRVLLFGKRSYRVPPGREIAIQVTAKILHDLRAEILRILRLADEPRAPLYDVLTKGRHVRRNYRQPEAVAQKENTALKDVCIRQNQHVRRFKVQFRLFLRDVLDTLHNPVRYRKPRDLPLNDVPIVLIAFNATGDD